MAAPGESGERVIAATRRADGSLRKPVRIRQGFKSEELGETGVFKSRAALVGPREPIFRC
jgi:hypothetical protein